MRKFISAFAAIVLMFTSVVPTIAFAAENADSKVDEIMWVEYSEFYNNRSYYDNLIKKGYVVNVSVDDEHADIEIDRITHFSDAIHKLSEASLTRGADIPTTLYNIHTNTHYDYEVLANYQTIYTNVKIYGCTTYEIDVFNRSYSNSLTVYIYGTSTGRRDFTVPPRTSTFRTFSTNSENDCVYAAFKAPSDASGSIFCIGH